MNLFWKKIPQTTKYEQEMATRHLLYNSFVKTEKSTLLEEYKELVEIDFKHAKKVFKNNKEYLDSTMYQKELRYQTLSNQSDIKIYLAYEKSDKFAFNKNYTQVAFEEFSDKILDSNKWKNGYKWAYDQIKGSYSNDDDYQAYTEGSNTSLLDGKVHIVTKQENAQGRYWDKEKGFAFKPYNFTSDIISSNPFKSEKGCIMIKFRLEGSNKSLHHFIRAYDSANQRCITLLESRSKRRFIVGRALRKTNVNITQKISGLNLEKDFHILELEWNKEVLSWKINGVLIHQESIINELTEMHLAIGSYLSTPKGGEGRIIIDYIRLFDERKAQ